MEAEHVLAVGRFAYKTAQDLGGALRSAGVDIENLLESGWTGAASDAYGAGWHELHEGGVQITDALTNMAELLGITADNYTQQDSAFGESLNTLQLD